MTLFARNAALFYLSFLVSGLVNVVPQSFFARAVPGEKQAYLAATLVAGTLGSIGGVSLARHLGFPGRPARAGAALLLGIAALAWLGLSATSIAHHIAFHVAVRAAANFTTQELDRRAVSIAGELDRQGNDQVSTGLRFGGMLLGPLWFGLFPGAGLTTALALAALMLLSIRSAVAVAAAPPPARVAAAAEARLSGGERVLVAAAVLIYGSYYLLASNIVYVLSDLHGRRDATSLGGALITVVYGAAIAATVGVARVARAGLGLGWMLVSPAAMLVVGLSLSSRLATVTAVVYTASVVLGLGFALFLLALRNHVTAAARAGRGGWIAVYNNLGNTSALAGFMTMLVLVSAGRAGGVPYGVLLSGGVAALGLGGLVIGVWGARAALRPG